MEIEVLFEDGEALVINKPSGLPMDTPRRGGHALTDYLPDLRFGFQRLPMPVHRLDMDTSGCLLLARNPKALKRFSAAFAERLVTKTYMGIVAGDVEGEEGVIEFSLTKTSTKETGWRMIAARKGKPSVTGWAKLSSLAGGLTLVQFMPETGRTHQIRVHALLGLKNALLGDPVYGDGAVNTPEMTARRTMLHAGALVVPRGNKPDIVAQAPIPADFLALGVEQNMPPVPRPSDAIKAAEAEAEAMADGKSVPEQAPVPEQETIQEPVQETAPEPEATPVIPE